MARRGNGLGSVYQRKSDGRWVAALSVNGKQRVLYGRTKAEASAKLRAGLAAHERGELGASSKQPLGTFLAFWLEEVARPSLRPETYRAYESRIRIHILPALGSVPLDKLTPRQLHALYAAKRAATPRLSEATIAQLHGLLYQALKLAERWSLVPRNVAALVDPPPRERHEPRALSREEIRRLLVAMRGHHHAPFWMFLLFTGMRFGEAAALRWSDVELGERPAFRVTRSLTWLKGGAWQMGPTKTKRSRRVLPMTAPARAALRAQAVYVQRAQQLAGPDWQEHELVFPGPSGRPLRESSVLLAFHRLQRRAGLPRFRLHDLRSTFATRQIDAGTPARVVQELLGHSTIGMTLDTYTGALPVQLGAAVTALDDLLEDAEGAILEPARAAITTPATTFGPVSTR